VEKVTSKKTPNKKESQKRQDARLKEKKKNKIGKISLTTYPFFGSWPLCAKTWFLWHVLL